MTIHTVVFAMSADGIFGKEGHLPWKVPRELEYFRALTRGATVVMGRKTYESIPARFLEERLAIVFSRQKQEADRVTWVSNFSQYAALQLPLRVFVIGGREVLDLFFSMQRIDRVHRSIIPGTYAGDVVVNEEWLSGFSLEQSEDHGDFRVEQFVRAIVQP